LHPNVQVLVDQRAVWRCQNHIYLFDSEGDTPSLLKK
jgi:hypothetical protein